MLFLDFWAENGKNAIFSLKILKLMVFLSKSKIKNPDSKRKIAKGNK